MLLFSASSKRGRSGIIIQFFLLYNEMKKRSYKYALKQDFNDPLLITSLVRVDSREDSLPRVYSFFPAGKTGFPNIHHHVHDRHYDDG